MTTTGLLVCVGTGIKGIGQLTLEAAAWIEHADIVCHCCPDPVTVAWLRKRAKRDVDLTALYSDGRQRERTYESMVDVILSYVREGLKVCAVFYGHPGLFVWATHKACATAKKEGHDVRMLPGVSAVDCLYSDLGFDPAQLGCVMYEATDLLLRGRPLNPSSHLILWQVGVLGDVSWKTKGFSNRHVGLLVDYLATKYPQAHEVFHYQGTQYPMWPSTIQRVQLQHVQRDCQLTPISTLYLPPCEPRANDPVIVEALGLFRSEHASNAPSGSPSTVQPGVEAIAAPSGVPDVINRLACEPALLLDYHRDPEKFLTGAGLLPKDLEVMLSQDPARMRAHVPRSPSGTPARGTAA